MTRKCSTDERISFGNSYSSHGVYGTTSVGPSAIYGFAVDGYGIQGESASNAGVYGSSRERSGVEGYSENGTGVCAQSVNGNALVVKGSVHIEGSAVGQVTLAAGQAAVTVWAPAATASSLVLLTPAANLQGQLWVRLAAGAFTIESSTPPAQDVPIAYLVIN